MARPRTPLGGHGKIKAREIEPKLWEARCRVKDPDGRLRAVQRQGRSKTAAINALAEALGQRNHDARAAELTADTRLRDAGEVWLRIRAAEVDAGDLAPRTVETYESAWRVHVVPALGELRLCELSTYRCEAWLQALRKRVGPSMCKTSRAVLSGILGYAARMDVVTANPVRDVSRVPGKRTRKPRSMTRPEREAWLAWMDTHAAWDPDKPPRGRRPEEAERNLVAARALGDVTRFLLATGCRIGEAMAVSWDEVDLDAGTVQICWHMVRVKGRGLQRMEGAKSDAGDRVLRLPRWAVDMLMRRRVDTMSGYPVFPDTRQQWRDPNQVMRWLRWSRDAAGFSWVTSHVFRQTVITVLDEAGLSTREVADQAGHAQIRQTQDYMARRVASDAAAAALEDLL